MYDPYVNPKSPIYNQGYSKQTPGFNIWWNPHTVKTNQERQNMNMFLYFFESLVTRNISKRPIQTLQPLFKSHFRLKKRPVHGPLRGQIARCLPVLRLPAFRRCNASCLSSVTVLLEPLVKLRGAEGSSPNVVKIAGWYACNCWL